jgi:hypothetical protein
LPRLGNVTTLSYVARTIGKSMAGFPLNLFENEAVYVMFCVPSEGVAIAQFIDNLKSLIDVVPEHSKQ